MLPEDNVYLKALVRIPIILAAQSVMAQAIDGGGGLFFYQVIPL